MNFRFNSRKATQAASMLLGLNGGSMDKAILIKMLYIVDREAMRERGVPVTGDSPVSMDHGPVLSTVYDLTKGSAIAHREYWEKHISDADSDTNEIRLKAPAKVDELSRREQRLITEVFERFRDFTFREMRNHTHDTFAEYEEVGKTSKRIAPEKILAAVQKESSVVEDLRLWSQETAMLDLLLSEK